MILEVCSNHVNQGIKMLLTPHISKIKSPYKKCRYCKSMQEFIIYNFRYR